MEEQSDAAPPMSDADIYAVVGIGRKYSQHLMLSEIELDRALGMGEGQTCQITSGRSLTSTLMQQWDINVDVGRTPITTQTISMALGSLIVGRQEEPDFQRLRTVDPNHFPVGHNIPVDMVWPSASESERLRKENYVNIPTGAGAHYTALFNVIDGVIIITGVFHPDDYEDSRYDHLAHLGDHWRIPSDVIGAVFTRLHKRSPPSNYKPGVERQEFTATTEKVLRAVQTGFLVERLPLIITGNWLPSTMRNSDAHRNNPFPSGTTITHEMMSELDLAATPDVLPISMCFGGRGACEQRFSDQQLAKLPLAKDICRIPRLISIKRVPCDRRAVDPSVAKQKMFGSNVRALQDMLQRDIDTRNVRGDLSGESIELLPTSTTCTPLYQGPKVCLAYSSLHHPRSEFSEH